MGIDIGSALVVGLPYEDICEVYKSSVDSTEVPFYNWTEEKDISRFSPYYDADYQDCVFGFKVAGTHYTYDEVGEDYVNSVNTYSNIFYKLTGLKPKLYVTADVT